MLERTIDKSSSGREYVQYLNLTTDIKIGNSCFFNSLKSRRRQRLTNEVCSSVKRELDSLTTKESDPFSKHPELDNFNIYAADGTELKSSTHETRTFGKRYPVSHIFALNLRTHSSAHVCYLKPEELKKKKHEIKGLQELDANILRMETPVGKKIIYAYDPAIVDYNLWYRWKKSKAIYIITREKANSAFMLLGHNESFDVNDPRNTGVVSDDYIGPSNGYQLRRVTYQDPVTGKIYKYITNQMDIP